MNDKYYQKYLKYKTKYTNLQNKLKYKTKYMNLQNKLKYVAVGGSPYTEQLFGTINIKDIGVNLNKINKGYTFVSQKLQIFFEIPEDEQFININYIMAYDKQKISIPLEHDIDIDAKKILNAINNIITEYNFKNTDATVELLQF